MADHRIEWMSGLASARCKRCGASVYLVPEPIRTWLDPSPVSQVGELLAALEGRPSFDVTSWGAVRCRGRHEVRTHPHGTADRPVYVSHACGQPVPVSWQGVGPAGRVRAPVPDVPPF